MGSYTYNATRKHAVANAGSAAYLYDANGNLTSRSGATVQSGRDARFMFP